MFNYSNAFTDEYLNESIELGRSFVQKKYWNTNALNYLWQGIGAFLANSPNIRYLFGAVSISNNYPETAKQLIVFYFNKWFSNDKKFAVSKNKFLISQRTLSEFESVFNGSTYKEDYRILKMMLKPFGFSVPVLLKHYSELCEHEGVQFSDFGIDQSFENCVDGFILVYVDKIKFEKRERYIEKYLPQMAQTV